MNSPSILVVDDEPDNFDVIETFLSIGRDEETSQANHQNYQLHYVANAEDAIATLDTFKPDVILLDVMMPGMDGIAMCRQVKAMPKWRAVPIIMVTALSSKSSLSECLAAGADDFISKPVNALELRARVSSMLRIKQQYDDLQALLKLREDMVRMIVHDLRNPLSNILLGLQALQLEQSKAAFSKETLKHTLTQTEGSARSLQASIDDLLKMAVMESGTVRLSRQTVDLCDLLASTLTDFEATAAKKNQVLINQSVQEHQPVSVDPKMFRRVLDNLLSNAIKFAPPNTPIIVSAELYPSGYFNIQVIDYGPGVPDVLQQKIFEKYEIGMPMLNVSQIGLGLAFCKMVIAAHGGNIGVRHNQPNGAIFEIELPVSVGR